MIKARPGPDHLIFLLLGVTWGTNFLLTKVAGRAVSPLQLTWLRVACGALPILVFAAARGRLNRRDLRHWPHVLALAFTTSIIPYLTFARGSQDLKSGAAGAIAGVVPLLTALLTSLVLPNERPSWRTALGLVAGAAGVGLVVRVGQVSVAGEHVGRGLAFMLAGALSYAVAVVYQRRFVTPLGLSPIALACYQTLIATMVLTVITPKAGLGVVLTDPNLVLILIFGLGAFGTGLAFIMYYHVIEVFGAVRASAVFYLPPVIALIMGAALAGEPLAADQVVGVVLILTGVWLAKRS